MLSVDEKDLNLVDCFGKHKKVKYLVWFGKPGDSVALSVVTRSWAVILSKERTVVLLVAIKYNATLDADLQSARVSSRGLFKENNERYMQRDLVVRHETCVHDIFNVQVSAIVTRMIRGR